MNKENCSVLLFLVTFGNYFALANKLPPPVGWTVRPISPSTCIPSLDINYFLRIFQILKLFFNEVDVDKYWPAHNQAKWVKMICFESKLYSRLIYSAKNKDKYPQICI